MTKRASDDTKITLTQDDTKPSNNSVNIAYKINSVSHHIQHANQFNTFEINV